MKPPSVVINTNSPAKPRRLMLSDVGKAALINVLSAIRPCAGLIGGLALAGLLGACAPMQQNTLQEHARTAFPDLPGVVTGQGVPSTAMKVADYAVSYDDAFRAANISVSQAQLNVEEVDKKKGQILATREAQQMGSNGRPIETRYFYAISVTELGAKRSRVRIVAKVQAPCFAYNSAQRLMYDVGSFGTTELVNAAVFPVFKDCKEYQQPNWPHATPPELGQFQVFVRSNLLAAGLL
jgi:hypothetical protein